MTCPRYRYANKSSSSVTCLSQAMKRQKKSKAKPRLSKELPACWFGFLNRSSSLTDSQNFVRGTCWSRHVAIVPIQGMDALVTVAFHQCFDFTALGFLIVVLDSQR